MFGHILGFIMILKEKLVSLYTGLMMLINISCFVVKIFNLELSSRPSLIQDGKTMKMKLRRSGSRSLSQLQNVMHQ